MVFGKIMNFMQFRRISTLLDSAAKTPNFGNSNRRNWNPIPLPHGTLLQPQGQDLDFVNVAHSHLVHSDWAKLHKLALGLTPFRVKHILLRIQRDYVLSLEFFKWVELQNPSSHTLVTHSMIIHILTKHCKFKSAESILRKLLESGSIDLPYYGFLPMVESCNAYMSSLSSLNRVDIALAFYREMRRSQISPNVHTLNMVTGAYCKLGKLEKAVEVFGEMKILGFSPTVATYNILVAGYCNQGLLSSGLKLKSMMEKNGVCPNHITYNTLIHGFCKAGKLHEANKLFSEMKGIDVAPNVITYNTLINGYSQVGNTGMGGRLFEEMSMNGVKADILTYNALILGLCKEGKTKKAAYLVKELDKENLVPNSSTFSALISGQCARKNADRAFQLYKSMISSGCHPNESTLKMLITTFCKNEDYCGALDVLREMLERSMAPDLGILSELCDGLRQSGKVELVMGLCNDIEARHLMPEGFEKDKSISSRPNVENQENVEVSAVQHSCFAEQEFLP
ncbi:unnamed protein product [Ilex paraguariensis]|uniref:Pentatricopeptide repeat-containing protein n=1 Tax=Ilex paraguariensis TaxID=185542 RepID=A0ABC8UH96_9AQUA